jgi:hypothetical protein
VAFTFRYGGIYVGAPGSIQAAAVRGSATPAGGNYSQFGGPDLNGSGQVAFLANLTSGSCTQRIFAGSFGSIQAVALSADYGGLSSPVINGSGQVAFNSDLGIFVGAPGSVQAVALGAFNGGYTPELNDSGQVAFTGGGGLFAGSSDALETILLIGDVINVASGGGVDDRTVSSIGGLYISGGQDGSGMSLNDSGLLVYEVGFTDGSSGIFTSQITPVPEPGSLGLVIGAAGFVGAWRLRRFKRAARVAC